jgi:hypothetical protein
MQRSRCGKGKEGKKDRVLGEKSTRKRSSGRVSMHTK